LISCALIDFLRTGAAQQHRRASKTGEENHCRAAGDGRAPQEFHWQFKRHG
jgi:hypothetical protein